MVINVAPLLLLLVFPVSGSQVLATVVNDSVQQAHQVIPPDIHSVLREMSAKLAEQMVEMRHLQQENKGAVLQSPLLYVQYSCSLVVLS